MKTKLIAAIAIMLALAAPCAMIAADALSDEPGLAAEGIGDELGGIFEDGEINITITTEIIFVLCIIAAVGMVAIAYYYRS